MPTKKKYLVETSAVRVALDETTPKHFCHFKEVTEDGDLATSIYIRMEFIRRWIAYYARMALKVDHYGNLSHAISHESESFSPRDLKTLIHLLSRLFASGKEVSGRTAGKELVHLAVVTLLKFDRRFRSRVSNSCGCRLGGKEFRPGFQHAI